MLEVINNEVKISNKSIHLKISENNHEFVLIKRLLKRG
jgi:hypothetical protein